MPQELNQRVVSLDAFRGFVMFSMLLGTMGLKEVADFPGAGFLFTQLSHADWYGFHFEDVILPAFLFVIGAAMAMATTVLAIVVGLFFLYSVPSESLHETVFERSITGRCTRPLIEHYRERMASRAELEFPER